MSEEQMVSTGAWVIAGLVGLLVALIGWHGNRIHRAIDMQNEKLDELSGTLHGRITDLDRRVTRVEVAVERPASFAQSVRQWPPVLGK